MTMQHSGTKTPYQLHPENFKDEHAHRTEIINQVYNLRYEVYCNEKNFLDPDDYPENLESDHHDENSAHFAVFHSNGNMAGAMRLIQHSENEFPLFKHCDIHPEFKESAPDLRSYAEISRLAVSKQFRLRLHDDIYGVTVNHSENDDYAGFHEVDKHPQPVLGQPAIVFNLYRSMYQESKRKGITHWVVAMEKSLHRLLKRMHFHFEPIGEEVDYYGPVTPYAADIKLIEKHVRENNPDLYKYMIDGLDESLIPRDDADHIEPAVCNDYSALCPPNCNAANSPDGDVMASPDYHAIDHTALSLRQG